MSKTLKVTYSKTFTISTQIGDCWEKVGFEIQVDEGERVGDILDSAHSLAQTWHMNANKEFYDSLTIKNKKPVNDKSKSEPDIIILKKYDNAVKSGDLKTKLEIEENYNII